MDSGEFDKGVGDGAGILSSLATAGVRVCSGDSRPEHRQLLKRTTSSARNPRASNLISAFLTNGRIAWLTARRLSREPAGLADNSVKAPDGTVWAGTHSGVSRYDGESWITYTQEHGLAARSIRAIVAAPDNTVWVSYYGWTYGASHFDGQRWITYTEDDGLPSNAVTCIAAAPDGTLWAGTLVSQKNINPQLPPCTKKHCGFAFYTSVSTYLLDSITASNKSLCTRTHTSVQNTAFPII